MQAQPLRASVVGIDGSGKSSTTLKTIDLLSAAELRAVPTRDFDEPLQAQPFYGLPRSPLQNLR